MKQLSFSLDQHARAALAHTPPLAAAAAHTYQPLLRLASLRASALLPAFAWLEVGPSGSPGELHSCCTAQAPCTP